jgi:ABC-type dipeptide/oligopeptide/nickel transport system ATPase subunit
MSHKYKVTGLSSDDVPSEDTSELAEDGNETDSSISTFKTENTNSHYTGIRTPEAVSPFVGIVDVVKRLLRLATQIRGGSTEHRNRKLLEKQSRLSDYDIDPIDCCRQYTKARLNFRFRLGERNEMLLHRLSEMNAFRRKKFLYLRKHLKKLEGNKYGAEKYKTRAPVTGTKSCVTNNTVIKAGTFGATASEKRLKSSQFSGAVSVSKVSQTTATGFSRRFIRDDEISIQETTRTIGKSTQIQINTAFIPPPPRVPAGHLVFECPYCSVLQQVAEKSPRRWRNHFLKDLDPFVCLLEGCADTMPCFHSQTEWVAHMESHNTRYACQRSHPLELFETGEEFEEHICQYHGQFNEQHMDFFKNSSLTHVPIALSRCPICDKTSDEVTMNNPKKAAVDVFWSHIATELLEIALWSLPEAEDDAESISSDQPEQRVAEASTVGSDASSLIFDISDADSEDWPDIEQFIVDGSGEILHKDEWTFVRHRTSSSAHEDPEQDKTLANFVRRLRLKEVLNEGKMSDPILPCLYVDSVKRNRDFYGRQSLLENLERALHPNAGAKDALSVVTLTGPSGYGKTQIAMEFVYMMQNQYDAILWVHADDESKLASDFTKIAVKLEFIADKSADSQNYSHARSLVKAWLTAPLKNIELGENSEKARWLIVFDHVIDARVLSSYWPFGCQSGSILITSRRAIPWKDSNMKVTTLPVEAFNPEDSAGLLSQLIKTNNQQVPHNALGKYAHHSPGQLHFLAKIIDAGRYSVEKFVKASNEEDKTQEVLLQLQAEDILQNDDSKNQRTDFAEWALECLDNGRALLDVMSMLYPDVISEKLLLGAPEGFPIDGYPKSLDDYYDARNELKKYTFITRTRQSLSLSIPRLIQDAARRKMDKERYRDIFNACITLINEQWPYQPFTWRHSIDRWPKCAELLRHINRLRWFSLNISTEKDDVDGAFEFARLATDAGWYCHERGDGQDGLQLFEISERICTKLIEFLDEDPNISKVVTSKDVRRVLAEMHHNRGCIYAEMNKPQESLDCQLIFKDMMEEELSEIPPSNDMRLSIAYNQLGVSYMINDDWERGEEYLRLSIQEMKRLSIYEGYMISLPLVNLGLIHWMNKRYTEAEEILQEGLAFRMVKFGRNDTESFM